MTAVSGGRIRRPVGRRWLPFLAVVVVTGVLAPQAVAGRLGGGGTCPSGNAAIVSPTLTIVQGGTATATFKIARHCSHIQVSLASYDAPSGSFGLPQTLMASQTGYYDYSSSTTYTQTGVPVSPCFYQVDFVRGAVITNLTTSDLYGTRNIKWANGGSQCASKLTTQASADVYIGGSIGDSAILSGLSTVNTANGGTLTFKVWGPNNATCAGLPVSTSTVLVNHGSGTYPTTLFTPTAVGTYRWIAYYSGSAQNVAVSGKCGDSGELVTVRARTPAFSTLASSNVTLGGGISDTATLAGGYNPTGTITFHLYGPNDATCSGTSVKNVTAPVSGNGTYGPANFIPTHAGTYRWIASYTSGDTNNVSVGGKCNDTGESVTVSPLGPTLTTHVAADSVKFHSSVSDTATLAGASGDAGGTISFALYGPNDATCANTPVYTHDTSVSGSGDYASESFVPTLSGLYRWKATYSGDGNNLQVVLGCNEANESVLVGERDQTPPQCVLSATVLGPPLQLKITVQDAESGIASIDVTEHTNATVTWPGFISGDTSPIVITASKTNQSLGSHVAITVTNGEGIQALCDPIVPAVTKGSSGVRNRAASKRASSSALMLKVSTRHIVYGGNGAVLLSGVVPGGRAGQKVAIIGQACSFNAPSTIATVTTGNGGVFRYALRPELTTMLSARWNSRTSNAARVAVLPQVSLVRESAGRYRTDVSTTNGMFLTGKQVVIQRWTGSRWTAVGQATLAKNSNDDQMTAVSSAIFAGNLYGAKLRAVVSPSACYAGGTSAGIVG